MGKRRNNVLSCTFLPLGQWRYFRHGNSSSGQVKAFESLFKFRRWRLDLFRLFSLVWWMPFNRPNFVVCRFYSDGIFLMAWPLKRATELLIPDCPTVWKVQPAQAVCSCWLAQVEENYGCVIVAIVVILHRTLLPSIEWPRSVVLVIPS